MTPTIETFTTIHVGAGADIAVPYTVIVVEDGDARRVVRADGAPEWVRIGGEVVLREDGDRGPAVMPDGLE